MSSSCFLSPPAAPNQVWVGFSVMGAIHILGLSLRTTSDNHVGSAGGCHKLGYLLGSIPGMVVSLKTTLPGVSGHGAPVDQKSLARHS